MNVMMVIGLELVMTTYIYNHDITNVILEMPEQILVILVACDLQDVWLARKKIDYFFDWYEIPNASRTCLLWSAVYWTNMERQLEKT